jgi:hypothetical protein
MVGAVGIGLQRDEDVRGRLRSKPLRQDPDDRVGIAVEKNRAADHLRIAGEA